MLQDFFAECNKAQRHAEEVAYEDGTLAWIVDFEPAPTTEQHERALKVRSV